ncbi:hypothetical protein [uncultured Flavobacterium sp.]|uniref:hypothetical protein n=1 Tax=uncultured Flavobacterium sp. TaxID=165435 RepID=UPI002594D0F1|nr:hypothetical protein [uncultured Flavobacterium sp.]
MEEVLWSKKAKILSEGIMFLAFFNPQKGKFISFFSAFQPQKRISTPQIKRISTPKAHFNPLKRAHFNPLDAFQPTCSHAIQPTQRNSTLHFSVFQPHK